MNSTVSKVTASSALTLHTPHHLCWWSTQSLIRSAAARLSSLSQPVLLYLPLCIVLPSCTRGVFHHSSLYYLPEVTLLPSMVVTSDCPTANPCFVDMSDASAAVNIPFLQGPAATKAADTLLAAYLGFITEYRQTKSENSNNKKTLFSIYLCLKILVEPIRLCLNDC